MAGPIDSEVLAATGLSAQRKRVALGARDLSAAQELLKSQLKFVGPKQFALSEQAKAKGKSRGNFGVFASGQGSLSGGRAVSFQVQASVTDALEGVAHPVSRDQRAALIELLTVVSDSIAFKVFSSGTQGYFAAGNVYVEDLGTVSYAMRVSTSQ